MAFNQSRNETELDPDHPMSNAWPEVFENGREIFSEEFYQRFPWARHIDPFKEARRRSSRDIVSSDHHGLSLDSKAEAPPVLAFVNSLISLELDDLSDDEQQCPICREVYREGQYEEMPLVLPCKHVVGKDCLLTWLSSVSGINDENSHNTCPICRSILVSESRQPIDTPEGLRQLLRDANYILTAEGPCTLTPLWRHRWEDIKEYVKQYLKEHETEEDRKWLRFDVLMNSTRLEIIWEIWNKRRTETDDQLRGLRNDVLDAFEEQGHFLKAYFELKAGFKPTHGYFQHLSENSMEARMEKFPFGLQRLIKSTHANCFTGKNGSQFSENLDAEVVATPWSLDFELKLVRYRCFVDSVRKGIMAKSLQQYIRFPQGQELRWKMTIMHDFDDAERSGEVFKWLEQADSKSPGPIWKCRSERDKIHQLLGCLVNYVHKTSKGIRSSYWSS